MLARPSFFLVGSVTCWPDVVLCSRDESLVHIDYWTMKSRLRERKMHCDAFKPTAFPLM